MEGKFALANLIRTMRRNRDLKSFLKKMIKCLSAKKILKKPRKFSKKPRIILKKT